MSSPRKKSALQRTTKFETFESRIVFSVDSVVADLVLQVQGDLDPNNISAQVSLEQLSLSQAHESTGAEYVFNDYGFEGSGQTIAVIDSGIAWDHYALGGGYGENSRVVGGWDFAEGDADPYDDGPAGYHGTHVAGIIGSDDVSNRGVASGADLVGLRVFDDNGAGSLDWVEQALQWVHDHKDDFANPITTVNLSLGVDWNSNNVPEWASLEDEFAQLEADNIFISVAAGNSFSTYNSAGLAYPAVSDHVVPVASHDADGNFSSFSQRNERVLVAPGSSIRSTVPGHIFGSAESTGFLGASGTSMAAPYVAGSSAVLREAMQFMGMENITQDALYDHFRETATQFHDSVTGGIYHRLDLGAAIDAIIEDAHSAAANNATDLGSIANGELLQGTIGKVSDVDAFSFTAGKSGQMTINVSETHDLSSVLKVDGQTLTLDGDTATFDVVAGQKYTLTMSTNGGIGHYDLDIDIRETISSIDLGSIANSMFSNQSVSGESWYSVTASQDGILTASIDQTNVGIQVYDSGMNLVTQSSASNGNLRADTLVNAGQKYFVKVVGNDANFDLQLNNQVSLVNGLLKVTGTNGNDDITVQHRSQVGLVHVTVADTNYHFNVDQVNHVFIDGAGGTDNLAIDLAGDSDRIFLIADHANIATGDFTMSTGSFDSITVDGDSTDEVIFLDSVGNDQFIASGTQSSMTGNGFKNTATGITNVHAVSRDGNDTAQLEGSQSGDHFTVTENHTRLNGSNGQVIAAGFSNVNIDGRGGADSLVVHGSQSVDQFEMQGKRTTAVLNGVTINTDGIEKAIVVSNGANDTVVLKGTDGNDQFYSTGNSSILTGEGYQNVALNTHNVVADVATDSGFDTAWIADTAGNDQVTANHQSTQIVGNGLDRQATGFDSVTLVAENGGTDHAVFVGTTGNDTMLSESSTTWVWGAGYHMGMIGFESVAVDGNGGVDAAFLRGNNEATTFRVGTGMTEVSGNGYSVAANNFGTARLDGKGGQNVVELEGFDEDDRITAEGSALVAFLDGAEIHADNFVWLEARTEDDHSSQREISAVDFWYAMHGEWHDDQS